MGCFDGGVGQIAKDTALDPVRLITAGWHREKDLEAGVPRF